MPTPKRRASNVPVHPEVPEVLTAVAVLLDAVLRLTAKSTVLHTARPLQMADVNRTGKRFAAALHTAAGSLDECVQLWIQEQQRPREEGGEEGGRHVRRA